MDWKKLCKELQLRVAELEKENRELRCRLGLLEADHPTVADDPKSSMPMQPISPVSGVYMRSTPKEKIRLFRSLFRGRADVFARRVVHSVQKKKGGYAPVCANEWKYGVCIKPKGKCSKCENRVLVSLDDAIIYKHLSGKNVNGEDVLGLYPILPDDTCYYLAIDFDDGAWQENTSAVRRVCDEWAVPCGVERSRSGEGAHLWVFFLNAISYAVRPDPLSGGRKSAGGKTTV